MSEQHVLEEDLRKGLWEEPATLPPRWFYDERGSRLFDEITRLPEYYQTRAEAAILGECAAELIAACRPVTVLELGSGTSTKTRILLDAWLAGGAAGDAGGREFIPIDVSAEITEEAAGQLTQAYPGLRVNPVIADFHHLPDPLPGVAGRRLLLFLGGTIGNFTEEERARFLSKVRARLAPGDHLIIGHDLVKDPARLETAYDDAAGVTAEFNLNVLDVIARTVPTAGLDRGDFRHEARWNDRQRRIEMHLVAEKPVDIAFPSLGRRRRFTEGESILTEISRKFAPGELAGDAARAGFTRERTCTDSRGDFALDLYRV
ncbi:L-histidine N(alpha)-methyltransferase [Corynebacterium halotolerans]|uniref:Putative methyltransferase n=1 Tax=Corynebacterium halotolerans YIM 70093 = DSM 44683 TaxID=1121362 RepID=M1NNW2_9CORY|nr:L-histidine N(alpha)-methyltransferase [Corynebacterium halotolerans]AGF73018.1 putative methyltransferase [Corynebacterium halotolerans YIM 70093 = DSM 44683]